VRRKAELVHARGLDLAEAAPTETPNTTGLTWDALLGDVCRALEDGTELDPDADQMATWSEVARENAHARDWAPPTSVVYYMRIGNRVKIGTTRHLADRLAVFQPEELLGTEPGGRDVEQRRHNVFAEYHVNNEWFAYGPRLAEHIAGLTDDQTMP
jgi:hypothetical protein